MRDTACVHFLGMPNPVRQDNLVFEFVRPFRPTRMSDKPSGGVLQSEGQWERNIHLHWGERVFSREVGDVQTQQSKTELHRARTELGRQTEIHKIDE